MRIVFFQSGLGAGGAEKNIAAIANHRAAAGDEVHIVSMTEPKRGSYFRTTADVTIHVMQKNGLLPLQLARFLYVRRMMRSLNPDLVISFLTKINVLTLYAMTNRTFPIIASERNNPMVQGNNSLWKRVNLRALARADAIVMLTETAKADLPQALRRKADVIYVPCAPVGHACYRNLYQKRVIAVGRLDQQKGFDLLIDAFVTVRKVHPEATLTIFGEGKEREALEALVAEKELQDCVSLPGTTAQGGTWVEKGDLFVFSSRHEGLGNALAEATVAGMPSISFDCDFGPREIIAHGETGLLVPPGDVPALAETISELLANPDRQDALARAAAATNAPRFAPETIMAQWDAVIAAASQAQR